MLRREMKRLLLPLLALLALPTAVMAESFYLLVNAVDKKGALDSQNSWVVPMKTLSGCEKAGLKIISSDRFRADSQYITFECLENK